MIWLAKYWKVLAVAILLVAVYTAGRTDGANAIQVKWDADKLLTMQEQQEKEVKNQKRIAELEADKHDNLAKIDSLRADVARYRVRVPTSPCGRPSSATGSTDPTTPTGYQPDQTQSAFDDFTAGLESDAHDADTMMENCRVVMEWAKGLR